MVTITAKLTVAEITTAVGIFDNLSKVLIQRMFNMNFYRPFPDNYEFYIQPANVNGRQTFVGNDNTLIIGLMPGETDGTKAAVLAYIKKAAPTHIDLKGFTVPVTVPPVEEVPPVELQEEEPTVE